MKHEPNTKLQTFFESLYNHWLHNAIQLWKKNLCQHNLTKNEVSAEHFKAHRGR